MDKDIQKRILEVSSLKMMTGSLYFHWSMLLWLKGKFNLLC